MGHPSYYIKSMYYTPFECMNKWIKVTFLSYSPKGYVVKSFNHYHMVPYSIIIIMIIIVVIYHDNYDKQIFRFHINISQCCLVLVHQFLFKCIISLPKKVLNLYNNEVHVDTDTDINKFYSTYRCSYIRKNKYMTCSSSDMKIVYVASILNYAWLYVGK